MDPRVTMGICEASSQCKSHAWRMLTSLSWNGRQGPTAHQAASPSSNLGMELDTRPTDAVQRPCLCKELFLNHTWSVRGREKGEQTLHLDAWRFCTASWTSQGAALMLQRHGLYDEGCCGARPGSAVAWWKSTWPESPKSVWRMVYRKGFHGPLENVTDTITARLPISQSRH